MLAKWIEMKFESYVKLYERFLIIKEVSLV